MTHTRFQERHSPHLHTGWKSIPKGLECQNEAVVETGADAQLFHQWLHQSIEYESRDETF